MLHARVVRPPSWFATLKDIDTASIKAMPGVVAVIRDGNFLAVAAEKEFQAVQAMRALTNLAEWEEKPRLPNEQDLPAVLQKSESEQGVVAEAGGDFTGGVKTFSAQFMRPYQMHASIGPSCSVAHLDNGTMTVWTHTQGVYRTARLSRKCLACRWTRCAASIRKGQVVMDTMAPTMQPATLH